MAFFKRMREAWRDALLDYSAYRALRFKRARQTLGYQTRAELDADWRLSMERRDTYLWWEYPFYWMIYLGQFFNVKRRWRERQELASILRQRDLSLALLAQRHD